MIIPPWIEITTVIGCKNNCTYCPQSVLLKAYNGDKVLTLDNFKYILKNVPKNVIIDFAGFAEPFLNKDCSMMMLWAYNLGYKLACNTTMVGMNEEDKEIISKLKFEYIAFHDVGKGMKPLHFMIDTGKVENPISRAGNLWKEEYREKGKCQRALEHNINIMLPNGDVVLCCNDYALKHKLGNLFETNFNYLTRQDDYELCHYCQDYKE